MGKTSNYDNEFEFSCLLNERHWYSAYKFLSLFLFFLFLGGQSSGFAANSSMLIHGDSGRVAAGGQHSCAIQSDGAVRCWGFNGDGQATPPEDLGPVVAVSAGRVSTCAIKASGAIRCWGSTDPVPNDLEPVVALSQGNLHVCAVLGAGTVRCWGNNGHGQAMPPDDLGVVIDVSAGSTHTCAVKVDGVVRCWGNNNDGKSLPPDDLGFVTEVRAGTYSTCAVEMGGAVHCWGSDFAGVLSVPSDLLPVVNISMKSTHACVVQVDGMVRCWGRVEGSTPPSDLGAALKVSTGSLHSCALLPENSVRCWGANSHGQAIAPEDYVFDYPILERIDVIPVAPSIIPGGSQFFTATGTFDDGSTQDLSGGLSLVAQSVRIARDHACAVKADGSVICWGGVNQYGETTPPDDLGPVRNVSPGMRHTCATQVDGTVRCWGRDTFGQATPPNDLDMVVEVHAADEYSCAVRINGTLRCWGRLIKAYRYWPNYPFPPVPFPPYDVSNPQDGVSWRGADVTPPEDLGPVLTLTTGPNGVCAVMVDHTVRCWGTSKDYNAHQDRLTSVPWIAAQPPHDLGAVSVVSTSGDFQNFHVCAVQIDGTVRCWGIEDERITPPEDLGRVVAVSTGFGQSCAVLENGTARCWGAPSATSVGTPPADLTQAVSISIGGSYGCAVQVEGTVRCWGYSPSNVSSPPIIRPTWTSSLSSVAIVDSDGVATGLSEGITDISAELFGVMGHTALVVNDSNGGGGHSTTVRYVRLVADSEIQGNPWTTVAELTVLDGNGTPLNQNSWTLHSVDSEELVGENGAAVNAFDGNPSTIWHTQWLGGSPPHAHEIVIDLGSVQTVSGFGYLPRQDGGVNGRIGDYRFYGSSDGVTWGVPIATGTFANTADAQQVSFGGTRYVRFVADSEANGNPWTSVAELIVLDGNGTPLNQSGWTLQSVDSEELVGENGAAVNAFDGKPATFWHTQWLGGSPAHPHEIVIDLGAVQTVSGFGYLPRQDGGINGRIAAYRFYGSSDGASWGAPLAIGTFADSSEQQQVVVGGTRYVRLVAASEVSGNPWTSVAELTVLDQTGTPIDKSSWTLQSVDSEEVMGENAAGVNAFDGNPATFWHTAWSGVPGPPHEILIDLGVGQTIGGFRYLPRQDGGTNGRIGEYQFYGSTDGVTWGVPLVSGAFADTDQEQEVLFP